MQRKELRTAIRLLLADPKELWSDATLNQAIDEVNGDFSRVTPRERIHEITVDYKVSSESFTINHGTAVSLANKPIEYDSETVKVSTTSYTRDTDYTMDYANGAITALSSGNITDGASATIDYNKSRLSVDLSSITDMIKPWKVEYPVGSVPQNESGFEVYNNILWITSSSGKSQDTQADKSHVRVYYNADHTAPTDTVDGSFARFLDQVMVKGAVSYSLFMRYRALLIKADQDSDGADAVLGSLSRALDGVSRAITATTATNGPHDQLGVATGRVGAVLVNADSILAGVRTYTDDANTALDKVATHTGSEADAALDKVNTHLAAGSDSADTALKKIAAIATDINTAVDKVAVHSGVSAETALDAVATHLTGSTSSSKAALDEIATIQGDVKTALALVSTHLSDGTNSSVAALNRVQTQLDQAVSILSGVGPRDSLSLTALAQVTTYLTGSSDSAKAAIEDILDKGLFADADAALSMMDSNSDMLKKAEAVWEGDVVGDTTAVPGQVDHMEGSSGGGSGTGVASAAQDYLETGDGLINTVNLGANAARLNMEYAMAQISLAQLYADRRKDFLSMGDRRVAQSQMHINEAQVRMSQADRLIAEGAEWSRVAQTFISEAGQHHQASQTLARASEQHHQNAGLLVAEATQRNAIAGQIVEEAVQRLGSIQAYVSEAAQRANIADAFIREAIARNAQSRAFIDEADQRNQVIQGHIAEASQRRAISDGFVAEASERNNQSAMFIAEAAQRVNLSGALMSEAQQKITIARTDIEEANAWASKIQLYINEAGAWIAEIDAISRSADAYLTMSSRRAEIADRVREDAENRHREYWDMLQSRVHMARQSSRSNRRQYPDSSVGATPDVPTGS
jgi:hypothetical protein